MHGYTIHTFSRPNGRRRMLENCPCSPSEYHPPRLSHCPPQISSSVGGRVRRPSDAPPNPTTMTMTTKRMSSYLQDSDEEDKAGPKALPEGMTLAVPPFTSVSDKGSPSASNGDVAAGKLQDAVESDHAHAAAAATRRELVGHVLSDAPPLCQSSDDEAVFVSPADGSKRQSSIPLSSSGDMAVPLADDPSMRWHSSESLSRSHASGSALRVSNMPHSSSLLRGNAGDSGGGGSGSFRALGSGRVASSPRDADGSGSPASLSRTMSLARS